jgi:hypothetical protein
MITEMCRRVVAATIRVPVRRIRTQPASDRSEKTSPSLHLREGRRSIGQQQLGYADRVCAGIT